MYRVFGVQQLEFFDTSGQVSKEPVVCPVYDDVCGTVQIDVKIIRYEPGTGQSATAGAPVDPNLLNLTGLSHARDRFRRAVERELPSPPAIPFPDTS